MCNQFINKIFGFDFDDANNQLIVFRTPKKCSVLPSEFFNWPVKKDPPGTVKAEVKALATSSSVKPLCTIKKCKVNSPKKKMVQDSNSNSSSFRSRSIR